MALIEETLFGTEDKVALSIQALQSFQQPDGYYVAFSGGKDSVVVKALCDMAGVKYDAHYSVTSVDPPELVQFIKEQYPDVSRDIPRDEDGNAITMWNLIPKKLMPPTRIVRYCCAVLKETGGYGRMVVTGVRWAESSRRAKNRALVNIGDTKKSRIMLNNDNDESRHLVESCFRLKKTTLNPIINWSDENVWEFIHKYNIPYCKLYDEGYHRLGCLGCPQNTAAAADLVKYPTYRRAYIRAFDKMVEERKKRGLNVEWGGGEEVMEWWLSDRTKTDDPIDGQIALELGDEF